MSRKHISRFRRGIMDGLVRTGFRSFLAIALLLPLPAQHDAKKDDKPKHPAIGDPVAIAAGAKLFTASCAGCHGPKGEGGRGPNLRSRGSWHPLDEEELFQVIQKGVPGADMPGSNLPDEQIWRIVAFVRALTAPAIESPPSGDAKAGEELFWGKADCGRCHRILGRGGMLGPDLSNIGAVRPAEQLRESILQPDADGFPGYRGVVVKTAKGQIVRGVARNRTNYSIQILDESGKLHLIPMTDVREIDESKHSPMPGDYKQRLSREEIDNVVAFLSRQSVRPYVRGEKKEK
jgi:putative heme-binding domain-containing protein